LLDYSLNDFDGAIETGLGSVLWWRWREDAPTTIISLQRRGRHVNDFGRCWDVERRLWDRWRAAMAMIRIRVRVTRWRLKMTFAFFFWRSVHVIYIKQPKIATSDIFGAVVNCLLLNLEVVCSRPRCCKFFGKIY
jgi:hypothetical protein